MRPFQFELLDRIARPGDAIYTGYGNPLSKGISLFQWSRLPSWESNCSHVGFKNCFGQITESSISLKDGKLVSGVHIRDLKSWIKPEAAKIIVVQRLGFTEDEVKRITEVALRLKEKKMFYPVFELAGTALMIAQYNFWKALGMQKKADKVLDQKNLFNHKNARYCISFTSHCFSKVGKPLVRNEDNCTVGEGIRFGGGEIIRVYG